MFSLLWAISRIVIYTRNVGKVDHGRLNSLVIPSKNFAFLLSKWEFSVTATNYALVKLLKKTEKFKYLFPWYMINPSIEHRAKCSNSSMLHICSYKQPHSCRNGMNTVYSVAIHPHDDFVTVKVCNWGSCICMSIVFPCVHHVWVLFSPCHMTFLASLKSKQVSCIYMWVHVSSSRGQRSQNRFLVMWNLTNLGAEKHP